MTENFSKIKSCDYNSKNSKESKSIDYVELMNKLNDTDMHVYDNKKYKSKELLQEMLDMKSYVENLQDNDPLKQATLGEIPIDQRYPWRHNKSK